jgi:CRISPR-associated protein Cmr1
MATVPAPIRRKQGGSVTLSFPFEVITPVFGGGVFIDGDELKRQQKAIDPVTPVRAPSIRGQLRFWWRAAFGCMQPTLAAMRGREAEIWGASSKPGKVALRVVIPDGLRPTPFEVFEVRAGQNGRWNPRPLGNFRELAYGAFPLQPKGSQPERVPAGCLWKLDGEFCLELSLSEAYAEEVRTTVQLWLTFGGVGGRTRRGFGAVASSEPLDPRVLVDGLPHGDVASTGIPTVRGSRLAVREREEFSTGLPALQAGLGALQRFRQGPGVGRNPPSNEPGNRKPAGRSRWPEPDEIRRLSIRPLQTLRSLRPDRVALGSVAKFPRAAFGMPIIFHFVDRDEPKDTTLKPTGAERLASPLIVRPFREASGRYRCLALVLGGSFNPAEPLELQASPQTRVGVSAALTPEEASRIMPLAGNADVLGAFLDFFRRY